MSISSPSSVPLLQSVCQFVPWTSRLCICVYQTPLSFKPLNTDADTDSEYLFPLAKTELSSLSVAISRRPGPISSSASGTRQVQTRQMRVWGAVVSRTRFETPGLESLQRTLDRPSTLVPDSACDRPVSLSPAGQSVACPVPACPSSASFCSTLATLRHASLSVVASSSPSPAGGPVVVCEG